MAFKDLFLIFISKRMQRSPWVGLQRKYRQRGEVSLHRPRQQDGPGRGVAPRGGAWPAALEQHVAPGVPAWAVRGQCLWAVRLCCWPRVRGSVLSLASWTRKAGLNPRPTLAAGRGWCLGTCSIPRRIHYSMKHQLPGKHCEKRPSWPSQVAGERGRALSWGDSPSSEPLPWWHHLGPVVLCPLAGLPARLPRALNLPWPSDHRLLCAGPSKSNALALSKKFIGVFPLGQDTCLDSEMSL